MPLNLNLALNLNPAVQVKKRRDKEQEQEGETKIFQMRLPSGSIDGPKELLQSPFSYEIIKELYSSGSRSRNIEDQIRFDVLASVY